MSNISKMIKKLNTEFGYDSSNGLFRKNKHVIFHDSSYWYDRSHLEIKDDTSESDIYNYFLYKIKILFTVCRMHHLCIKIGSIIQQFLLLNTEHFTQIVANIVQMNRGCQYILMKATDLMTKYFLHII